MVASSLSREGKSSILYAWAYAAAAIGNQKVLLVDANIRNPELHCMLSLKKSPGLSELLSRKSLAADDVIQQTAQGNLYLLSSGEGVSSIFDLIASKKMDQVTEELKSKFDLILFDSPAAIPYSD